MRITRIEGTQVSVPVRAPILTCYGSLAAYPRTIVHVHTDEGLVGLGEVSAAVSPATLAALGRAIEGFNPWELGRIRTRLENWGYYVRHERAIAAIEIALLDLLGKAIDKPVHELIGGALRDRVPAAAYLFFNNAGDDVAEVRSPAALVDWAEAFIGEHGFRDIKVKGGVLTPEEEVETLRGLHARFPDHKLRLDPQGAWSVATSIRVGRALADLPMEYLEDPTTGMVGMAEVRRNVPMPLSTNMCVTTLDHLGPATRLRPVDVILSDIWYFGGVSNTMALDAVVGPLGLTLGMHSGCELGIGMAAMVHVAAALPHLSSSIDAMHPLAVDDIVTEPIRPKDGAYALPVGPGLGVTLDEDKVARYAELFASGAPNRASDPTTLDETRPGWFPVLPSH